MPLVKSVSPLRQAADIGRSSIQPKPAGVTPSLRPAPGWAITRTTTSMPGSWAPTMPSAVHAG